MKKLLLKVILLILFYPKNPCWAQSAAQQAQRDNLRQLRQQEEQRRLEEIRSEFSRQKAQQAKQKGQGTKTASPRFLVKRIEVARSAILSRKEIAVVVKKYQGKYLSISELQLIVRDLNQLYTKHQGNLSRAVLPPQKIKNGVVKIILVESKLGKIIFEKAQFTSQEYLRWALPIDRNKTTNFKDLEDIFIRFNKTHNNVRVRSRLRPGSGFNETDVIIKVIENKRWGAGTFIDSEGTESTGTIRYGLTLQNSSLVGFDDQIIVGTTKSEGQFAGFISYDFPFSPFGTRAKILYSKSEQDVVGGSLSDLNIQGGSSFLSGKLTHPLLANNTWKVSVGGELSASESSSLLGAFELENNGRKYAPEFSLNKYDARGAWIFHFNFQRILKRSSTAGTPIERRWLSKWVGNLTRYHILSPKLSLVARFSTQYSPNFSLPISEQFALGGSNNISYELSTFSGDQGHALGVEAQYTVDWEKYIPPYFQASNMKAYLALQEGQATSYNLDGSVLEESGAIISMAIGVRSQFTNYASAELSIPLSLNTGNHSNRKTRGLLFSLKGHY